MVDPDTGEVDRETVFNVLRHHKVDVSLPALMSLLELDSKGVLPFFVSWVLVASSLLPKWVVERIDREQGCLFVVPERVFPWMPACAFQIGLDTP